MEEILNPKSPGQPGDSKPSNGFLSNPGALPELQKRESDTIKLKEDGDNYPGFLSDDEGSDDEMDIPINKMRFGRLRRADSIMINKK